MSNQFSMRVEDTGSAPKTHTPYMNLYNEKTDKVQSNPAAIVSK